MRPQTVPPLRRRQSRRSRRGRPLKFGRPSRVVVLTLPSDLLRGLRKIDPDPAWAIVSLFENRVAELGSTSPEESDDADLVGIAKRRSLIVINRSVFRSLPGVNIIPLHGDRAFLALGIGQGTADLELAVGERLASPGIGERERKALFGLQARLRSWRHDRRLRFHTRAIILVERVSL